MNEQLELKIGSKVRLLTEIIEYIVTGLRKKSITINNGQEKHLIERWYADIKDNNGGTIKSVAVEHLELIN